VSASALSALGITGAGIPRTIHRKILRFAQDDCDGGDAITR
jgi:hypothetical protein